MKINSILYRFVRWCPGAAGLWLRQKMMPSIFKTCGKGCLFGRCVDFVGPEKIMLGDRVVLNNGVVLDAGHRQQPGPGIILEDDVFIGTSTEIRCGKSGVVTIRSGANFSSFCTVRAENPLSIGRNILAAAYCVLGIDRTQNMSAGKETEPGRTTEIGDGCWLGVRMKLYEGASIGKEAIIGAHAVVEEDVPSYAVAVGRPARIIRDRRAD